LVKEADLQPRRGVRPERTSELRAPKTNEGLGSGAVVSFPYLRLLQAITSEV
jgi:hypothetical protein